MPRCQIKTNVGIVFSNMNEVVGLLCIFPILLSVANIVGARVVSAGVVMGEVVRIGGAGEAVGGTLGVVTDRVVCAQFDLVSTALAGHAQGDQDEDAGETASNPTSRTPCNAQLGVRPPEAIARVVATTPQVVVLGHFHSKVGQRTGQQDEREQVGHDVQRIASFVGGGAAANAEPHSDKQSAESRHGRQAQRHIEYTFAVIAAVGARALVLPVHLGARISQLG